MSDAAGGLRMSERRALRRLRLGDPHWPVQLCLALIIVVQLTLADQVSVGPGWIAPAVEAAMLVVLIVVAPTRATHEPRGRRELSMTLLALVSAFIGPRRLKAAYALALSERYRFLSYGDAMWLPAIIAADLEPGAQLPTLAEVP